MGRNRIEIRKIENHQQRMVCFSKRRAGINKKLEELRILCGAEGALLAITSAGRGHGFGTPSVESIIERFYSHYSDLLPDTQTRIQENSEIEKKRKRNGKEEVNQEWWLKNCKRMKVEELLEYKISIENLLEKVRRTQRQVLMKTQPLSSPSNLVFPNGSSGPVSKPSLLSAGVPDLMPSLSDEFNVPVYGEMCRNSLLNVDNPKVPDLSSIVCPSSMSMQSQCLCGFDGLYQCCVDLENSGFPDSTDFVESSSLTTIDSDRTLMANPEMVDFSYPFSSKSYHGFDSIPFLSTPLQPDLTGIFSQANSYLEVPLPYSPPAPLLASDFLLY